MGKTAYNLGAQKTIPAVLIYLRYQDRVLMMKRAHRPNDPHSGKWNGLGGKCEIHESHLDTAIRECLEESGLRLDAGRFSWHGTLIFPNFRADQNEDWWVTIWCAELTPNEFQTQPLEGYQTDEGSLHWVSISEVENLPLWEGDRHFLPKVWKNKPFFGHFEYQDGKLISFKLWE